MKEDSLYFSLKLARQTGLMRETHLSVDGSQRRRSDKHGGDVVFLQHAEVSAGVRRVDWFALERGASFWMCQNHCVILNQLQSGRLRYL